MKLLRHALIVVWLSCSWACLALTSAADTGVIGYSGSINRWQTLGFEQAWQLQSAADGIYNRLLHVTPYLSAARGTKVYEVISERGRQSFSPYDVDRLGRTLADAGAARRADIEKRVLKALGVEAAIETRDVPRMTLFVQTDRGLMQAIDGERGVEEFRLALADQVRPATPFAVNDDFAVTLVGSQLSVIRLVDRKIQRQKRLVGVPGTGVAMNKDHVYVHMFGKGIERYPLLESGYAEPLYSAGELRGSPILRGNTLSWSTSHGHLYVADAQTGAPRFRIETRRPLEAPPVIDDAGRIYLAGSDGYVFAVDAQNGSMIWELLTGSGIKEAPLLIGESLYLVNDLGRLVALTAANGEYRWEVSGMKRLAGATATDLLTVDEQGQLVAIRRTDGSVAGRTPLGGMQLLFTNELTDRIYLGDDFGQIVCLRPIGTIWPHVHRISAAAETTTPLVAPESTDKARREAVDEEPAPLEEESEETPFEPGMDEPGFDEPGLDEPGDNPFGDPLSEDGQDPFGL